MENNPISLPVDNILVYLFFFLLFNKLIFKNIQLMGTVIHISSPAAALIPTVGVSGVNYLDSVL